MGIDLSSVGTVVGPVVQSYNWRDVALYAIGIGAGTEDLDYLLDDPGTKVVPTFGVIPAFEPIFEALKKMGGNLVTLLHSGERTELIRPFPPEGEMHTTVEIKGIWDMKIGALTFIESETVIDGEPVARTTWQLLLRGEGGFKGERPPKLLRVTPPGDEEPAFQIEVPTSRNQALLYRLNGDINPIHARPEAAEKAGFDRPILHGLCSYGIAARVALKALAGDDPARFHAFEARFAKVVMPGDTLVVEGWTLEKEGNAAITVTVKETGQKAISNALFEFRV
ncbi:MAG: MaoC family protein [Deltaproteobacteria bacterium]|nr:MaoC family protein [Deltaproteobacteria bacterium]